jgi:hypothetical protein
MTDSILGVKSLHGPHHLIEKNTMNSLFDNFKIDKLRSKKVDDDRDFAVEDFVLKVIHVLDFEGVPEDMSGSDAPLCKRAVHP